MLKPFLERASISSSPLFSIPLSVKNLVCKGETARVFIPPDPYKLIRKVSISGRSRKKCSARRRIMYEDDEEDEEAYGYNEEIAALEAYTQTAKNEALLVKAIVDEEEAEVIVFKGFSSSLSSMTSSDPAKSILPARAVIKCIDRVKGPMDPANIQYIEQGLTWEIFMNRLSTN